jgi:hypothetical protein
MAKYCGEVRNVSGVTGGGYLATGQLDPNDPSRQTMNVGMGSVVSVATELPVLQIGNRTFKKIRLCIGELAAFLRPGDTACIYVFRHMFRKLIIIGVRSQHGPSWTMPFGRMAVTVFTYLTFWALIGGIPGLLIGWFAGMAFGDTGIALGVTIGLLVGVGLAWLSAVRLVLAWSQMQHR